jgi:hypothetical protein
MEAIMVKRFVIAAATTLTLNAGNAAAAELPTFEKRGFPITTHQLQVVGTADVLERSSAAGLGIAPVSPHQRAVLRPRWN